MPRDFLKRSSQTKRKTMHLNILATSANPQTCARNLDTELLKQQIIVVSILLSSYAEECAFKINDLYKYVDRENPFMRWLFNDEKNVDWLKEYGILLHCEYVSRMGFKHAASKDVFDFIDDFRPPIGLDPEGFLNWACDDQIDFHTDLDVHRAYRNYLCAYWTAAERNPTWGDRLPPCWYIDHLTGQPNAQRFTKFTVDDSAGGRGRVSYSEGLSGGCDVH
jgi:hypothetical protein